MTEKSHREIKALITLLGDDDPKIRNIVWERLLAVSKSASPILKEVAFSDSEGKIRIQAQALLEQMRLDRLANQFNKLVHSREFDLEKACFLLAQIEYPDLNISSYIDRIEFLAYEAQKRIWGVREERRQVERINHYLFTEQGFRGNVDAFFEPENSYINKVLDRCLGIPVSLSALYLFITKRLDLPIFGVSLPGHFMLKYQQDSKLFYIDAFNNGRILSQSECENYLNQMGYALFDTFFAISTPKEILARMIRNLILIYHQNNQHRKIDTLENIFSDSYMH